ncbi:hypothetical protein ONZ45_g487 [Pleurotus djamor]|nr:hypothetical protein ONZ45_g487 [Pleurotus djamor]
MGCHQFKISSRRTSTAAFSLVLQMFLSVRKSYHARPGDPGDRPWRLWLLLVAPYVALIMTAIATASVGAANPTKISRNRRFFYCSVEADPLTNTMTISAAFILFATVIFEVWTVILLYRLYQASKRTGSKLSIDLSFPIRIIAFGFYIMLALCLSLISIKSPRSPAPDLIISTAATVVIVIFGTQKDILKGLCFWRRLPSLASVSTRDNVKAYSKTEKFQEDESSWAKVPSRMSIA